MYGRLLLELLDRQRGPFPREEEVDRRFHEVVLGRGYEQCQRIQVDGRCDIALLVHRVIYDEGTYHGGSSFLDLDGGTFPPFRCRGLQNSSEGAVFYDQEFAQVSGESAGVGFRPVCPDPFHELLQEPHLVPLVDAHVLQHIPGMERCPVYGRLEFIGAFYVIAGHQVDIHPVISPAGVRVF